MQVEPHDNQFTEWLTYTFTDRQPAETVLELQWEKKAIPMKISVPNEKDLYIIQIEKELQNYSGFDVENYSMAANYLLGQNYKLDKALVWANKAVDPRSGQLTFSTVSTKANVLLKMGKKEEAYASFKEAVGLADASPSQVHQLGRTLISQNEKDMALKIFQLNYDKNNGVWPVNVGMTRGLAALGRYEEAIQYAEAALPQAPDEANKKSLASMIEKLKSKQDIN